MKLCRAGIRAFSLPLVAPLSTAHGPIAQRRGRLIRLEDEAGRHGLGEATPLPEFGTEGLEVCERALMGGIAALLELGHASPAQAREVARRDCSQAPCARAALECAIEDLAAQQASSNLASFWRRRAGLAGEPAKQVAVQALVGGESPDAVAESARQALGRGHHTFKLKLAVSSRARAIEPDLERVAALREAVGSEARLRLDANEAWTRGGAQSALRALADFDIDYVEQPVARGDLEGLRVLDREGPIPVAADEALLGDGLARCLAQRAVSILIVKPAALGGVSVAIRLMSEAQTLGLRIVWSSLLDGAISRSAGCHLAAALGPEAEVHGLATGSLLGRDFVASAAEAGALLRCPQAPGLGLGDAVGFSDDAPLWVGRPRFVEAPQ
ncbi:MAG: o-succinylbenzoate synthase [Deltaproteobacteria bacterium]|nr:o-succinylbenzoate synthase [Deltaproteobacteria bacterium]